MKKSPLYYKSGGTPGSGSPIAQDDNDNSINVGAYEGVGFATKLLEKSKHMKGQNYIGASKWIKRANNLRKFAFLTPAGAAISVGIEALLFHNRLRNPKGTVSPYDPKKEKKETGPPSISFPKGSSTIK